MRVVKLGDVARESRLKWTKSKQDVPIVGLEHLIPDEIRFDAYDINTDNTFSKRFVKGQVLFGRRRAYQRKAAIAEFDGICSGDITVIEAIEGKMVSELLPFIIQTPVFFDYANRGSAGSLSPRVKWEHLLDYEFELPSLEEQKVLADKLWAAYRLKEAYKKLLVATDEMVKSQFIEMFGDCKSQGTLSSLCATFIDGDWIESKDQSDNGIRLIQTGNVGFGFFKGREDKSRYITEETFKKLNCTEVMPGDILISRLPDPIGRACIVPEGIGKAITAVDCTIVRLNATLLPEFLISFSKTALYASQINKIKTGTTRLRVSRGNLGNVIIPIPPIESQHRFAAIAQQADKSIIIRKPSRGIGNPLNQNDFWNLAGRAGRLGKEYSGNIFCIEPLKWSVQPEPNKAKQEIKRALNVIENKGEELLDYIRHQSPRQEAEKRPDLEFAFGYFYIRYVLEKEIAPSNPFYNELMTELYSIQSKITLPSAIIKKNPGISPLAQQELYNFFTEHLDEIDTLIPVYPNDTNAFEEYKNLIDIIGRTISYYPQQLNASRAILLINWMSGKPLSYLIRKSYESYKRNRYNKKLPAVIREVMENVESFVRYQFAKDSSCYVDILRYVLEINNKQELLESIPQLNLWLEFGVSQKTHLSLLALGLSRNTVLELTDRTISTEKSKEECLTWLRSLNLDELELSPIIIDDIKKVL